ncbi:accessory Sec system protein Asp3 [Lactococcus lactis]|nr:accessory Sec system protein Asp3 [Lactococcus lactis]
MSECYIMRWPKDLSSVYVNGATIQYSSDQSVYYSNEVLSPGQTICTWTSMSDYLSSGSAPSLPLLKINKTYELGVKLEADTLLAIQLQINFFDENQVLLDSYRGTEVNLVFKVPRGTVSYEVRLVNLRHHWLLFNYLSISEIGNLKRIKDVQFSSNGAFVHICPLRESTHKSMRLIVNNGPRSILPISLHESINYEQIFVFTNGKEINQLIKALTRTLPFESILPITIEAGLGFYSLPREKIQQLIKALTLNQINQEE